MDQIHHQESVLFGFCLLFLSLHHLTLHSFDLYDLVLFSFKKMDKGTENASNPAFDNTYQIQISYTVNKI